MAAAHEKRSPRPRSLVLSIFLASQNWGVVAGGERSTKSWRSCRMRTWRCGTAFKLNPQSGTAHRSLPRLRRAATGNPGSRKNLRTDTHQSMKLHQEARLPRWGTQTQVFLGNEPHESSAFHLSTSRPESYSFSGPSSQQIPTGRVPPPTLVAAGFCIYIS